MIEKLEATFRDPDDRRIPAELVDARDSSVTGAAPAQPDRVIGPVPFVLTSGTYQFDGNEVIASTATLGSAGAVDLAGPGEFVTEGTTSLDRSTSLGGGLVWSNTGTIVDYGNITGGDAAGGNASFVNAAGGTFDIAAGFLSIADAGTADTLGFLNQGLLEKTGGGASGNFDLAVVSTGTIAGNDGVLEFDGGGTFSGVVEGTGLVNFGAGTNTVAGTLVATNAFQQTGGAMSITAGSTLVLAGRDQLGPYGTARFDGPGTLLTPGTLVIDEGVVIGGSLAWSNTGTIVDYGNVVGGDAAGGNASFVNAAGGTFDIAAGYVSIADAGTADTLGFLNQGLLEKTAGAASAVDVAVVNTGTIRAADENALVLAGAVTGDGTGRIELGGGAFVELSATSGQNVVFDGTGFLQLDNFAGFVADRIAGLQAGDTIELVGSSIGNALLDGSSLIVSFTNGKQFTLDVSGPARADQVTFAGDEVKIACFREGTRIETDAGPVAVERLRVGDRVVTHAGVHRPIRWIGHRRLFVDRQPEPERALPVRIVAGAFGPQRPRRDVELSPDHAVFVRGVLIPVQLLVNGSTIVRVETDRVVYFHVELETHDVLVAEGLEVESYVDTGNRGMFANAPLVALHPEFEARQSAELAFPMVLEGEVLDAVRADLGEIAEAARMVAAA